MDSMSGWLGNVFAFLFSNIGFARGDFFKKSDIDQVKKWKAEEKNTKEDSAEEKTKSQVFWKNLRNVYPDPAVKQTRHVYACLHIRPNADPHASLAILGDNSWMDENEMPLTLDDATATVYEIWGKLLHLRRVLYKTFNSWKVDYSVVQKRFIPIGQTELSDDQLRMLAIWCKPDRYTKLFADCMTFVRAMAGEIAMNENGVEEDVWRTQEKQIVASQNAYVAQKEDWKRRGKPMMAVLGRVSNHQKCIYRFSCVVFLISLAIVIYESLSEENGYLRMVVSAVGEGGSFLKRTVLFDSTFLSRSVLLGSAIPATYFGYKCLWKYLKLMPVKMREIFLN